MRMDYRNNNLEGSWIANLHRLVEEWDLLDIWLDQELPPNLKHKKNWAALLKRKSYMIQAKRDREEIARSESSLATNYYRWRHFEDPEELTENQREKRTSLFKKNYHRIYMAEYIENAGFQDTGARILYAVRTGKSMLKGDKGRWAPFIPEEERICEFCDLEEIDDAEHTMNYCTKHNNTRKDLNNKLKILKSNLTTAENFEELMK